MNRRRTVVVLAAVAVVALAAFEAAARPGGGQGYSGGGSSGGGGSSSGGGDGGLILYVLIRLIFEYPAIGIPVAIVVAFLWWKHGHKLQDSHQDTWASVAASDRAVAPTQQRRGYAAIRARDPAFSAVLFEDFVYALYARVQAARVSAAAMAALAPYVAEGARTALLGRDPVGVPIGGVVIGAMRTLAVRMPGEAGGNVRVELEFEANFTASTGAGPQGYYVVERWSVERAASVVSKPAGADLEFRCPNCGAPFAATGDERCGHCGQDVGHGKFDWTLTHVQLLAQETRPPALTADVAERGTDAPTVYDPEVRAEHAALIAEDPGAQPQLLEQRLRKIYAALNTAWTGLDLRRVRPFVSDSLYNYLEYWIQAYRQQGLRNMLEDMAISRVQIVKLTRDRHFDAITLRFWASGSDYTVRVADGKRVAGSKSRPRAYSEYWTLIRGSAVRGAPRASDDCPSCGAPLDRVNMAGTCEYCGSHLTRGEFDWVLSKIEQDDSYVG